MDGWVDATPNIVFCFGPNLRFLDKLNNIFKRLITHFAYAEFSMSHVRKVSTPYPWNYRAIQSLVRRRSTETRKMD